MGEPSTEESWTLTVGVLDARTSGPARPGDPPGVGF